jgi:hypothetical protein
MQECDILTGRYSATGKERFAAVREKGWAAVCRHAGRRMLKQRALDTVMQRNIINRSDD